MKVPVADRPLYAIALRLIGMLMISTMFMLMKYLGERGIATPELIFWRQIFALLLILGGLAALRRVHLLRTRRSASHATRAVTGNAALICNITAAVLLPLADATVLSFTTPLFAVFITALVVREHVGRWRWLSVLLGFAGVLIMSQPGHGPVSLLGIAAGLGGGFLVAIVSFQVRDLTRTDDPIACVFWFSFFGTLLLATVMPVYMTWHTWEQWSLIATASVVGTVGQLLFTLSLRFGSVATVLVMDYTALIWATVYGWLIWENLPTLATWLGAPVIIAAGLIITWRERRIARVALAQGAQTVAAQSVD